MTVQLFINLLDGQNAGPLPPQARAYRTANLVPELRELQAIGAIHRDRLFAEAEYTGVFSPKFPVKTRLTYDQVVSFIADNPGHDVYLFDHGAPLRYYNFNLLERCENVFPGFEAKFIEAFAETGEDVDFSALGRSLPDNTVNGNFWAGNARFWREVIGDALRLIEAIHARPAVWRRLCEPVVANGSVYPYLPFILERYVSYWLMTRTGMDARGYPRDREGVLGLCVRSLERPLVSAFHDLFNEWDAAGAWTDDRRTLASDLSRAFHRQLRGSGESLINPWSRERIGPVL
jgi:hypothetical protein